MKKSAKLIALAMAAVMAVSVTACGSSDSSGSTTAAATEAATEAAAEDTEETAADDTAEEAADDTAEEETEAKEVSADATVFKLGTTVNEQDSFQVAAEKFAELVSEYTDGAYAIDIYPNGVLGGERDMLESMQMGTLDMGIITSGPFINFSDAMGVLDMPFLFTSNEEAYAVLDGDVGRELLDTLEDANLKGLAYAERGFRNITNSKHPIESAADVEGLKLRIMENDVYAATFKALGANANEMAWADCLTALQQGTVDGEENPINVIFSYSLWESQDYVTLDRHSYSTAIITMGKDLFDSLDADTQDAFLRAAQEAAEYERGWVADQEADQLQALKDNGMEVVENPNMNSFKEAVQPVYDEYPQYADYVERINEVILGLKDRE